MNRSLFSISLLLIAFLSACDSVQQSSPDPLEGAPLIEQFSISPQRVIYALLDESAIDGDSVRVSLSINAQVQTYGTEVPLVSYAILSPDTLGQPIRSGSLAYSQNGRFTARVNFAISAFEVQSYPVLIYVTDHHQRLGGEARTSLEYARFFEPQSPPVIDKLIVPETFQRPSPGQPPRRLTIAAEVSDPDGLNDLESVEFWNEARPSERFIMCDDGNQHPCGNSPDSGDELARDGIYSRTIFILAGNALGLNTFVFEAVDRSGLRSAHVKHTLELTQ